MRKSDATQVPFARATPLKRIGRSRRKKGTESNVWSLDNRFSRHESTYANIAMSHANSPLEIPFNRVFSPEMNDQDFGLGFRLFLVEIYFSFICVFTLNI